MVLLMMHELEETDLFRDIRLSDIINEIADIKGIKAITYLHLPFTGISDTASIKSFFNEWIEHCRRTKSCPHSAINVAGYIL